MKVVTRYIFALLFILSSSACFSEEKNCDKEIKINKYIDCLKEKNRKEAPPPSSGAKPTQIPDNKEEK